MSGGKPPQPAAFLDAVLAAAGPGRPSPVGQRSGARHADRMLSEAHNRERSRRWLSHLLAVGLQHTAPDDAIAWVRDLADDLDCKSIETAVTRFVDRLLPALPDHEGNDQ